MGKILAFSGSARRDSYNTRLLTIAVSGAIAAGADVSTVDLESFGMPLYNQDYQEEHGFHPGALEFKNLLLEHDGLLIASPEYNGMITPLLKNALDWASRSETEDEPVYQAYKGKVAAVMAASPGYMGGRRGLAVLRLLLNNIGVMIIPEQVTISRAESSFNEDGSLKKENRQVRTIALGRKLTEIIKKLNQKYNLA